MSLVALLFIILGADVPDRLLEAEANPVGADPADLTRILEDCREANDTDCIARALLARAEAFDQGGRLFPEVEADAGEAVKILTPGGPSPALAGALLLAAGTDPERLDDVIEMATATGARSVQGRALCRRAGNAIKNREFETAGADLAKARRFTTDGNLPRVTACIGYYEGLALHHQWKPAEAREVWIRLIDSMRDPRASRELLWTRIGVSAVSINPLMDIPAALEHGRAAVALADRLQGDYDRSKAYVNLTSALRSAGRYAEAEAVGATALELSRRAGSLAAELIVLRCLGEAEVHRGERASGLGRIERSAEIATQLGDDFNLMLSLASAGTVLRGNGDLGPAAVRLLKAQQLADRFRIPFWRSTVQSQRALLAMDRGNLVHAEELVQTALDIIGPGDREPTAWALDARGRIRELQDDLDGALDDFRRANELFQELDLVGPQATTALEIGNIYYRLSRMDRAGAYYRRTLELAEESGAETPRQVAQTNLALIALRYGRLEDHRDTILTEAGRLAETTDPDNINQMLNLSERVLWLDEMEAAERLITAAERVLAEYGTNRFAAKVHRLRAELLSSQGRDSEALVACSRALEDGGADSRFEFRNRWRCALVHESAGDLEGALALLRSAESAAWKIRNSTDRPELRATLLADQTGLYADLVRVMLALNGDQSTAGFFDEVLAASDRFRSWNLLDALVQDDVPQKDPGSERRLHLLNQMAQLQLQATGQSEHDRQDILEQIRLMEERLAELSPGTPIRSLLGRRQASTHDLQSTLPPGTVLLEYLLGGGSSYVLAIRRDKVLVASLGMTGSKIFQDVMLFRALLRRQNAEAAGNRKAIDLAGARLYRSLLSPVEEMLKGADTLVVCPDLSLHELPFEALVMPDGRYLAEQFQVATVPSLAFFLELRARERKTASGPPLVVLADPVEMEGIIPVSLPGLPFSRKEAHIAVRRAGAGSQAILGSEATESAARRALESGAQIVHFATHGFLDARSIGRSGILLTPDEEMGDDGLLQAREVIDLKLSSDLIVLSGCSTGGRYLGGEGLIGLPHALFQAGAPTVVMSLWEVRDGAAAVFMDRFYGRLSEGLNVGAALRAAKLDLIGSGRDDLSHPSVWSPFVLAGLGDVVIDLPGPLGWRVGRGLLFSSLLALAALLWGLGQCWRRRTERFRAD